MKLKTIIQIIKEFYMPPRGSVAYGSMSSRDTKLRPVPGGMDDVESWDGIVENKDWFCYAEGNDWQTHRSGASIYINENEKPHKIWIKIKTNGLRKPNDTNESHRERIKKHTNKVARSWMSAAKKIHNNPDLNEVGNPIPITWKQAFLEAINDAKVKKFISGYGEKKITPLTDPVNFTPRK